MQDDDAVDVVFLEQSLSVEGQRAVAMAAVRLILHQLRDPVREPETLGPDEGDHDLEEVARPRVVGVQIRDVIPTRLGEASVASGGDAAGVLMTDHPNTGVGQKSFVLPHSSNLCCRRRPRSVPNGGRSAL